MDSEADVLPPGLQLYVYGPLPPEVDAEADPLATPQVASVVVVVTTMGGASVMVAVVVCVHP